MSTKEITDRLHAKFIAVPERHARMDLAYFLLVGAVHLVGGVLIFRELPGLNGLPELNAVQLFSSSFWWVPFAAGTSWIIIPILVLASGTPLPRLLTLSLQIAALCSGFAVLSMTVAASVFP